MPSLVTASERARIRSAFPALAGDFAYLENAGGSQVPAVVADRIRDYMLTTYVQVGAGYPLSATATQVVADAHAFVRMFMNGENGHVILGSSTTTLLRMLADCYAEVLRPGQEIILAETAHEANHGPWTRLASRGLVIRPWRMDPETFTCSLDELAALLTPQTAIVAFPHVSNLLGDIVDVQAVTRLAHRAGARVVVDGVAYAPHRAIDVRAWNVDWYAYSTYKVYGPHMAALYGRQDALAELTGPNHFFVPREDLPYKFEPGGPSHEGCAGLLALGEYLKLVAGEASDRPCDRGTVTRAYDHMTALERPLQEMLIEHLRANPTVRLIGPAASDDSRVPTVSFIHRTLPSREIAARVQAAAIGIRHGHMYAYHLVRALGLDPADGVVRASFVHYNTPEEADRLIAALGAIC
jgi:cysteine desulfurase family protein (TIGR01976 family)